MPKYIAILGSTGSVGIQALDVVRENPGNYRVTLLSAFSSHRQLAKQALEFRPDAVVIGEKDLHEDLTKLLDGAGIRIFSGTEPMGDLLYELNIDLVLNAIVGYAGFEPTICTIMAGKDLALANKESLVVGGQLVTSLAKEKNVTILPVDSEHSAIFQCLQGEDRKDLERVLLTASGGPFSGHSKEELQKVTINEALNHPTWNMGDKITIDSATLMNKGLEVIEAKWLFGLEPEQLEVVVHPQSIIHSMVEFIDGSIIAQLSNPDMKLPIIYALAYPGRKKGAIPRVDFSTLPPLTFHKPDMEKFRNLALAFEALEKGGNAPCILNAANEIAVKAFLSKRIGFMAIPEIVEQSLFRVSYINDPDFECYVSTDKEARITAEEIVKDWEIQV